MDAYALFSTLDTAAADRIRQLEGVRFVAVTVGGFGGFAAMTVEDQFALGQLIEAMATQTSHLIDVVISVEPQATLQPGPSWLTKEQAIGESVVSCVAGMLDTVVQWLQARQEDLPGTLAAAQVVPESDTLLVEYTAQNIADVNAFFVELAAVPQVSALRTGTSTAPDGFPLPA